MVISRYVVSGYVVTSLLRCVVDSFGHFVATSLRLVSMRCCNLTTLRLCVRPCVLASMRSCVLASLRPCVLASLHPCVLASLRPCVLASSRPRVLASSRPRVLASSRPRVLASSRPRVLASSRPCVIASLRPCVLASLRPCVLWSCVLASLYALYKLNHFLFDQKPAPVYCTLCSLLTVVASWVASRAYIPDIAAPHHAPPPHACSICMFRVLFLATSMSAAGSQPAARSTTHSRASIAPSACPVRRATPRRPAWRPASCPAWRPARCRRCCRRPRGRPTGITRVPLTAMSSFPPSCRRPSSPAAWSSGRATTSPSVVTASTAPTASFPSRACARRTRCRKSSPDRRRVCRRCARGLRRSRRRNHRASRTPRKRRTRMRTAKSRCKWWRDGAFPPVKTTSFKRVFGQVMSDTGRYITSDTRCVFEIKSGEICEMAVSTKSILEIAFSAKSSMKVETSNRWFCSLQLCWPIVRF